MIRLSFKRRLVVYLENDELSLALASRGKVIKSAEIFLRETPLELVREKVNEFMKGTRPNQSILVLPRSEVLQKELLLSGERASLKRAMEEKLDDALPYSRKEMAYCFSLDQNNGEARGLLLALPEKSLREKLKFLNGVGLEIDEIITDDQALLWLTDTKDIFLLIDSGKRRILFLCGKGNQLLFSQSFAAKPDDPSELHLEEVSLTLLERRLKPTKLFITGRWNDEVQSELRRHFNCSAEKINPLTPTLSAGGRGKSEGEVSVCLLGAASFGTYPYLSLLPEAEKIKKKNKEKKKLLLETFGSFILFLAVLLVSFFIHLHFENVQIRKLETELTGLLPGVKATKEIKVSLDLLGEAQSSKEKPLELLKDLALKLPSQVTIKELSIGPKDFFFKGESSSHGFISETVDTLSRIASIKEAKLGETRLRKRLNEEYFEFEVTGKWVL